MDEGAGYGCGCLVLLVLGLFLFEPLMNFFGGLFVGLFNILMVLVIIIIAFFVIKFIVGEINNSSINKRREETFENFQILKVQNVSEQAIYTKALEEFGLEEDDVQEFSPLIDQIEEVSLENILDSTDWSVVTDILLFGEKRIYFYSYKSDAKTGMGRILESEILNYKQIKNISLTGDLLIIELSKGSINMYLDTEEERNTARGLRNLYLDNYR